MNVVADRRTLPVLYECDVAVIGGSFGGVAAALASARAGRLVALVEPRTYLGREVSATLRPWVRASRGTDAASLPATVASCIEVDPVSDETCEYPLRMERVKVRLEDMLLAAGVKLIYASLPVGLCAGDGRIQGVMIGNKSGRQVIKCRVVIDATATALVARLAGAEFEPAPEDTAVFACTLEFTGVHTLNARELPVPARLGLVGNRIVVHRGYRGEDHVLLEYELALPSGGRDALESARRDNEARRRTTALAEHLLSDVTAFDRAYVAATSYELSGPHAWPMVGSEPRWARWFGAVMLEFGFGADGEGIAATAFAGPVGGLWCLNEAARLDVARRVSLRDPVPSARLGRALAEAVHNQWRAATGSEAPAVPAMQTPVPDCGSLQDRLQVKEPEQPQAGRDYAFFSVSPVTIAVLRAADVVVVGGGSSGSVAGIISGQEGMRTVLVDMNPGLGGTGTYGGIYTYWFNRRIGFVDQLMGWLDDMHERLHLPRPQGFMARWNIQARIWALDERAEAAGVEFLSNAYVIASLVEGNAVRGVVAATRWGPVALLSEAVIDATGDGDVAAFAGAEYVYGSSREHSVMYAYMPQVADPGRPRNLKTSMVDVSNIEDYTRMILAERRRGVEDDYTRMILYKRGKLRRGEAKDHDHGIYVGPRESRHIKGEVVLEFTDQLLLRCFPDVVCTAFSNHDIAGDSSSDLIRMGLQAPNLEIEIPYRALVPKKVDGILVVGKAYSATHEALAGPRMQADLENLGGAAAMAAVMAVRTGERLRDVNIRALQERLVGVGALPARVLSRELVPVSYTDEQLVSMIDALDPMKNLQSYSEQRHGERFVGRLALADIMCAGPQVVPLLGDALSRAEAEGHWDRQVLLARILAILGSNAGVSVLISAIDSQLASGCLPGRDYEATYAYRTPPSKGAGPYAAHLIYCLGMAKDPRAIPIWRRTVELLADATDRELLDFEHAWYFYASAVCYGAERLGDSDAIPVLRRLHSNPSLRDLVSDGGFQPNYGRERLAYLEVLIGRALARCGSPDGFVVLIGYLNDVRAILAEYAHSELVAITGHDFGKSMPAWSDWLEREADQLKPAPWTGLTEPVAAWGDLILTEADALDKDV